MVVVDGASISSAQSAASKKVNDMVKSSRESPPPPKKSVKQFLKGKVVAKTIVYAKSNPHEVVICYAQSENPKRRLAMQAMGVNRTIIQKTDKINLKKDNKKSRQKHDDNDTVNSSRRSQPPPKKSVKQFLKGKVVAKTIDYAKSNPHEVVRCYAQSENPKRRLAMQAMGVNRTIIQKTDKINLKKDNKHDKSNDNQDKPERIKQNKLGKLSFCGIAMCAG
jgi:hypothetical protein